jgi:hypothetical protein
MATTAQVDAALTMLRAKRAKHAQAIEDEAQATRVRDSANTHLAVMTAARVTASAEAEAAKVDALALLAELEV